MTHVATTVFATFLIVVMAWVYYIAAMWIIPGLREKRLARWVRPFAWAAAVMAIALDVVANLIFSVILLDFPQDFLLTRKLQRLKLGGGWRAAVAQRICTDCLDAFDPSGKHC